MEVIQIIQKPYSLSLKGLTIDAAEVNVVTWKISGDVQYSYALTIKNNTTDATVYTVSKTSSYSSSHSIPASTLSNNNQYKISIQVWSSGDSSTATSDYEVFVASARPVIALSSTPTVASSSYTFSATYFQAQSIAIKSWIAYLYNDGSALISQSGIQSTPPLSYTVDNLSSGSSYFIEFQATSNNSLTGTSGKIPFSTFYSTPNLNVNLTIESVDPAGMQLSWDVTQIIGESNNPIYISGEELDTRTNDKAWFDTGYSVESDFTLKSWFRGLTNNHISDDGQIIRSASTPTNINALWLPDTLQTTPINIQMSVRNIAPTNNKNLWIQDSTQTTEKLLSLYIGDTEPNSSFVWINQESFISNSKILNLVGDDGRLALEYYSGKFYLSSYDLSNVKTPITSVSATGNSFYVYIQQIGDTYTLGVTVAS
jgi:hypothetical protein